MAPSAQESVGNRIIPQWKIKKWKKVYPEERPNFWPCFLNRQMLEALSTSKITLCYGTFKCARNHFNSFSLFGVKRGVSGIKAMGELLSLYAITLQIIQFFCLGKLHDADPDLQKLVHC